jgi:hypothetical protein
MSKLLELAQKRLGWPPNKDIISPEGSGPRIIAELAKRKIETAITRQGTIVNVGVLTSNPKSNRTEDPLAIVCDFPTSVSKEILHETHRLAWSFSRSPMLITVEPTLLRVWTCWKRPEEQKEDVSKLCVVELEKNLFDVSSLSAQAAKSLQWIELTSGNFFKNPDYSKYFQRNQRADQLMLEDLKVLRRKLLAADLSEDICHDLIARVIFMEFLFQRKDKDGYAALNENVLENLHNKGVLKKQHRDLQGILRDYKDIYSFFRELNNRFNGDLFPGKGKTPEEREEEWKREMKAVRADPHLQLLANFVSGKMEIALGQYCLWRRYAFDAIPLEFISSIYEEFVSGKKSKLDHELFDEVPVGVHYTPSHIVDLMLDEVLPWDGKEWDLKICDPSCGSGIFLVKAFQRLIYRWRKGHPNEKLSAEDLRKLLTNNLFGVDIDPHAVRVASFSLYLAMCDELEPRYYWQNVKFPPLREKRLVTSDFFADNKQGFRTEEDKKTYNIIIGNAPWGQGTASESKCAKSWASENDWEIANLNIGPLFLPKGALLAKRGARVIMLQPAGALLFNQERAAKKFREVFFSKYKVEKIINLSALRFVIFPKASSPACIVSMKSIPPDNKPIKYVFPKRSHSKEEKLRIVIEPYDVNDIYVNEACYDPLVWTSLAWGGRRDFLLMHRLSQRESLNNLKNKGLVEARRGIGRGKKVERQDEILNMPLFDGKSFPTNVFIHIDASKLPLNKDPFVYAGHSKEMGAFKLPQMLVKLTWRKGDKRFRAVLVKSNVKLGAVLPSASYVSVHVPENNEELLGSACLSLNSRIAVYYLMLSSGRVAFYRPNAKQDDMLNVPIPACQREAVNKVTTYQEIDEEVKKAFNLNDAEATLVEDLCDYTFPDFVGDIDSPGRQNTRNEGSEGILETYCQYFIRVLEAGFGKERKVSFTIFTEGKESQLPVRLVAIHLDAPGQSFIRPENIDSQKLIERLQTLNDTYLRFEKEKAKGSIFYQRVARVYDSVVINCKKVPTIFIIKPDQIRYWTRSMAMRDADEIASDIMLWQEPSKETAAQGGR